MKDSSKRRAELIMERSLFLLFLVLFASSTGLAQFRSSLLKQISQIKFLESNREDVKRILSRYRAGEEGDNYQGFAGNDQYIEVTYSDGTCSDDPNNDNASEIWNVTKGRVTRIELRPDLIVQLENAGFNTSNLIKEQRFPHSKDYSVYHNKERGLAIWTNHRAVEGISLFPSRNMSTKLCKGNRAAREFYSRESWFSNKLEERAGEAKYFFPSVINLELSAVEVKAGSNASVSVQTTAVDPENDVLTYRYVISAGKIRGEGSRVVWDLTGLPAGTYSITAGVDDGYGVRGPTITKTVTIK